MFVFYRYFLFIFALMKLNHSKLLKGVFTEIVGSLEHQSDIVSFANRHRARLAELNNKKNDKFKLLGIGRVKQIKEYEEIVGLYDFSEQAKNQDLIQVLPDYNLFTLNYYIMRHNTDTSMKTKVFYDFILKCVQRA